MPSNIYVVSVANIERKLVGVTVFVQNLSISFKDWFKNKTFKGCLLFLNRISWRKGCSSAEGLHGHELFGW